jgi:hypothetical protein
MSARLREPHEIRAALAQAIRAERRDALLFSVLTVVLTPFFLAISLFILLVAVYAISSSGFATSSVWTGDGFLHGTNFLLLLMIPGFLIRPQGQPRSVKSDIAWVLAGLCVGGLILYLSYSHSPRCSSPRLFWWAYFGLAILLLGLLGRGYVPRDHYYVRPGEWRMGETSAANDIEQADFWLGFAVAFPRLVLGAYGDIFGSLWLWQGLDERGLLLASDVLHALGARDFSQAEGRLRSAPPGESGRVLRWLYRLGYLRNASGHIGLSSDGETFLGVSEWRAV